MKTMRKYLLLSGAAMLTVLGVFFVAKNVTIWRYNRLYEKAGKGFEEKLRESKEVLDKAAAHIQSVFEHLQHRKA